MAKKEEIKSELLKISGVGDTTIEKLDAAGVSTIMSLAVSNPIEIATITGISESIARKIIKEARESLSLGFEKAKDFAKKRDKIKKISSGCSNFDSILDGGFESGCITEVYGQFGVGKSQLSHLLVVRALLEDKGNKAIFLDTENTFRPDRIKDFAVANGVDPDEALDRIYVTRAYNSEHQILLTDEIEKMLQKDNTFRIIVVDSLTSHFRAEYIGRGTLANRQQHLNQHMHKLSKLADLYNLVVLCTNQVSASPGAFFGDPTQPIGGHIVGHNSAFRIYMRPGKAKSIFAKLIDSPNLPQNECNFYITKNGFENEESK